MRDAPYLKDLRRDTRQEKWVNSMRRDTGLPMHVGKGLEVQRARVVARVNAAILPNFCQILLILLFSGASPLHLHAQPMSMLFQVARVYTQAVDVVQDARMSAYHFA